MLLVLLLETSGYEFQDGINHLQQHFSVPSLGGTQILIYIDQGVKGRIQAQNTV
jgi:hypothetical protein